MRTWVWTGVVARSTPPFSQSTGAHPPRALTVGLTGHEQPWIRDARAPAGVRHLCPPSSRRCRSRGGRGHRHRVRVDPLRRGHGRAGDRRPLHHHRVWPLRSGPPLVDGRHGGRGG
ncbi:hypothetical protein ACFFX0_11830 [Citricoccus parietis]|uniref:Uncharacterized protein n=1 Tax=Citricoccus parietis TaxID=592307 RepID=A0ABV5FZL8_9MICC